MNINTDYLIVGQGLAGTLLAYFLEKSGQTVHLIDDDYVRAASKVAAGIINPVTGRRYVKSWRIESLIPFARQTYQALEQELDIEIYHPRPILRALFNQREENDWQVRAFDPAYQTYIVPKAAVDTGAYTDHTSPVFAYGELRQGAQVALDILIRRYRSLLLEKNALTAEPFDYSGLQQSAGGITYGDIKARGLIFCEGARAMANPFFSHLPFEGNKGEALIVKLDEATFHKILKHRIFVVPLADDRYWIGSSSTNHYPDDQPTAQGRQYLLEKLQDLLRVPFTLEEHRSAIRPTVKDRRPLLGRHPDFPTLWIFNGLGTKGASLGPYLAKHFVDVLVGDVPIDPEVNIERFRVKASK